MSTWMYDLGRKSRVREGILLELKRVYGDVCGLDRLAAHIHTVRKNAHSGKYLGSYRAIPRVDAHTLMLRGEINKAMLIHSLHSNVMRLSEFDYCALGKIKQPTLDKYIGMMSLAGKYKEVA